MGNAIGKEQLAKLKELMQAHLSGFKIDADDAVLLADELRTKAALVKFDISNNSLGTAGSKVLSLALTGNWVMAELNVARNAMGEDGAVDVAKIVPTMFALETITFGDKTAVTMNVGMKEADFGGMLEGYEAQIVAAFLPKCQ